MTMKWTRVRAGHYVSGDYVIRQHNYVSESGYPGTEWIALLCGIQVAVAPRLVEVKRDVDAHCQQKAKGLV